MPEKLNARSFRNLKARLRSLLLSSVRNPRIIDLTVLRSPEKAGFASFVDLESVERIKAGDNLSFPFTGSGVIRFRDGSEFGIDAEHRDMEVYSDSDGFSVRIFNSGRFGRLAKLGERFQCVVFTPDEAMLQLYYRIKIVAEISEEYRDIDLLKKIEKVLDKIPDLKISLLSYLVHRDVFGESYEMDDLYRKLPYIMEEMPEKIDHSFLENVEELIRAIESQIYEKYISTIKTKVIPLGHSHIDLVWLWPMGETVEKDHRSFSSMTYLLRRNQFTFVQSMAWHYKFMEQNHPDLFDEIRKMVSEGKWVPIGGMMVEPDCNLLSGESLVRQILYGQAYFREHFNKTSSICWLPDTFGFPAQLPQILSKSGFDLFFTTKMSWNDTEQFPYDTFNWASPDGSTVIAHSHTRTYNSKTDFNSIRKTILENKISSGTAGVVPLIYGYGDGGGGPNMKMIQEIKSIQNLTRLFYDGPDPLEQWTSRLKSVQMSLPLYRGPLYLQYHRGTYTTHGDIKRMNRINEGKLFAVEAMFSLFKGERANRTFRNEWEILLKNQFHDILPGSSINQVYLEAVKDLEDLEKQLDSAMKGEMDHFTSRNGEIAIFCPYSFNTGAWVKLESGNYSGKTAVSDDGKQHTIMNIGNLSMFYAEFDSGLGFYNYSILDQEPDENGANMENNSPGGKTWIVETGKKDLIGISRNGKKLPLPEFRIFSDFPGDFDAWELDEHRHENGLEIHPLSIKRVEVEGYGIIVETRYDLNPGSMTVVYHFPYREEFAELEFDVDWKGNNRLLRMYIPVSGSEIRGEQPCLYSRKPEDGSAFEFPMHRVVSVDNNGETFVLLNRTKYGYSMENGFLGVTLLRSPVYPDPLADRGKNEFSFKFGFMHGASENQLVEEGLKFNVLPEVYHNIRAHENGHLKIRGAVLASLKKAENSGNRILRLVNYGQKDEEFVVSTPWKIKSARELDLLELSLPGSSRNLKMEDSELKGSIKAHEILTLEIEL